MSDLLARRLANRIASVQGRPFDREFLRELDDLMVEPHFEEKEGWQRFVDIDMRVIWYQIDKSVRLAVYLTALKAHYEILAKSVIPSAPPYHGQIAADKP